MSPAAYNVCVLIATLQLQFSFAPMLLWQEETHLTDQVEVLMDALVHGMPSPNALSEYPSMHDLRAFLLCPASDT